MPLVGWRNKNNEFKYTERPIIVIYYDVNYDHQYTKDTQYIRNKIVQVAKNFVGSNLKFAISSEDEYADEIKKLGIHYAGWKTTIYRFSVLSVLISKSLTVYNFEIIFSWKWPNMF